MVSKQAATINWLATHMRMLLQKVDYLESQLEGMSTCHSKDQSAPRIVQLHHLLRPPSTLNEKPKFAWNMDAPIFEPTSQWTPSDFYFTLAAEDITPAHASMDSDFAARKIQSAVRDRRLWGPLGETSRRKWLLHCALDFPGYDHLKDKVRKISNHRAGRDWQYDPAVDLNAIRCDAAARIQAFWRSFRPRCVQDPDAGVSKRVDIMTSLLRMGSGPTFLREDFQWPARSFKPRLGHDSKHETNAEKSIDDDAALAEGTRLAARERSELRSAVLIQRFWRLFTAPVYYDDPDDYQPVLLGFTQSDLDSFSDACRSILQSAHLLLALVSPAGELLSDEETLLGIIEKFFALAPASETADCSSSFTECVDYLFGQHQRIDYEDSQVPGSLVAYWIRRYFVHTKVQAAQGHVVLASVREHLAVAIACLLYGASGKRLPMDIII